MFETLVTHFESPVYMAKQISNDIGIGECKFREIWDTTDDDRTLGKRTLEDVIEEVLKINNCYSIELFEKIITKRKLSKIECFEHIHSEILPLLIALKERNIKIGLITNCYFEERDVIKNSIFWDYFDSVCMSCEVGIKKPDVEIFQRCMRDLSVEPEECLYIGDGVNQPAKRKQEFSQAESPLKVISKLLNI